MDSNKERAPFPGPTKPEAESTPPPATEHPTEFPVRVRSTFQPEVDLEVGQAEWTDLHRSGLLLPGHEGFTQKKGD